MCLICIEFDTQRMTSREARRALSEMVDRIGKDHAAEVEAMLNRAAKDASKSPTDP